jgi:hypothetical protein
LCEKKNPLLTFNNSPCNKPINPFAPLRLCVRKKSSSEETIIIPDFHKSY